MKKGRTSYLYAICDFFASGLAWAFFCLVRDRLAISGPSVTGSQFLTGIVVLPLSWVLLFLLTGFYTVSLKRSRLMELVYSLMVTVPGIFIVFFILLMQGFITDNTVYFPLFITIFFLQFILTYIPRLIITSITAGKVHKGLLGYRTLIIGSNGLALEIFRKIRKEKIPSGSIITGYVSVNRGKSELFGESLPYLGTLDDLPGIINEHKIEEVIIAIEGNEHDMIGKIIGVLNYTDVTVKAIPSLKDLLTGRVVHSAIFGTPLLEVSNRLMAVWQANIKQIMDYLLSVIFLLLLSPVIGVLAVMIKLSGKGPVIYSQLRTGKNGKSFTIYKLRSMSQDSEKDKPLLSSSSDIRVTTIGRFIRRHRLDEIPNLINVLKGEMSLVGPRPERQFFIDQIVQKAPHYRRLLKVKPGITSWGQVKYGYASNVDQMIERLEYDLLYLENMSLLIDLKIMIYTALIIINGKGV
jgi:exopolysaccharide biosynthesis polyprenyl glycosylphosphotransferase